MAFVFRSVVSSVSYFMGEMSGIAYECWVIDFFLSSLSKRT